MNIDLTKNLEKLWETQRLEKEKQDAEDAIPKLWSKEEILELISEEIGKLKIGSSFE